MKHKTRAFELKIEKTETLVVRRRRKLIFARCDACGRETRMLAPEEAAVVCGTSPRKIYQKIEAGQLHFVELPEGLLLVCLESLKGKIS
jgi:uncharacterized OB-fold protein